MWSNFPVSSVRGQLMRTLIYKRTHPGDPDAKGRFGIHDCMGQVRSWDFKAVIGVGGISAEPESHGLDRKVNWIGIGPSTWPAPGKRGPLVTFEHFRLYDADGPSFQKLAPQLAHRMYSKNVRVLMVDIDAGEWGKVKKILDLAIDAPSSSGDGADRVRTAKRCVPRTSSAKSIKGCSS